MTSRGMDPPPRRTLSLRHPGDACRRRAATDVAPRLGAAGRGRPPGGGGEPGSPGREDTAKDPERGGLGPLRSAPVGTWYEVGPMVPPVPTWHEVSVARVDRETPRDRTVVFAVPAPIR